MFGNPEVENSGPECRFSSENRRLVGIVRKGEVNLLQLTEAEQRRLLRDSGPCSPSSS